MRHVHVTVEGKVQGVGYRAWTVERAGAMGLAGWVRNRRDGTVEAAFAGEAGGIDEMLTALRQGPPHARVSDVRIEERNDPAPEGFTVLPTA